MVAVRGVTVRGVVAVRGVTSRTGGLLRERCLFRSLGFMVQHPGQFSDKLTSAGVHESEFSWG